MDSEKPLINKKVQLEKFPGKGGWTYARMPEIPQEKKNPFGWRVVKGFIDDYEIKHYHLMPMGNGQLFLPIKAAIRKKINKGEGDFVQVVLYADRGLTDVPEEFMACLEDAPEALAHFQTFPEKEKKKYLDWIYAVKTETLQVERMAVALAQIARGKYISTAK